MIRNLQVRQVLKGYTRELFLSMDVFFPCSDDGLVGHSVNQDLLVAGDWEQGDHDWLCFGSMPRCQDVCVLMDRTYKYRLMTFSLVLSRFGWMFIL